MNNSVCSSFKEVITISPVKTINHKVLYNFIKSIIIGLEDTGYKIFCVISDNMINSKAMSNFSIEKRLNTVYPHPVNITSIVLPI